MYISALKEPSPPSLSRARDLLSPYGLVSRSVPLPTANDEPAFAIWTSLLGDPSRTLDTQQKWDHSTAQGNFDGAGGAIDQELARDISIVESLERYSSCAWDPDKLVMAREDELGDAAISPNSFPRCSESELAVPGSDLVTYDPRLPIQWQRAWSLTRNREVFVPACAVYLRFRHVSRSELFMHSVSTGTAAHSDMKRALLNGLLEVIERDSLSLSWLQQMRLPGIRVDENKLPDDVMEYYKAGTSGNIETRLFDATTDFGVPVIYGIQLSDNDDVLSQVVAATCELDPHRALAKMYREFASLRIALRTHAHTPQADAEIGMSVVGGAVYQAQRERRKVFDFLLEGNRTVIALEDVGCRPEVEMDELAWVIGQLAARNAEVIAVDISTDEARQAGMCVVKVLVPQAMPLSFVHGARYLATPRLYEAPAAMGMVVHDELSINHEVQPFA